MKKRRFGSNFVAMACIIFIASMAFAVPAIGQDKHPAKPITLTVGFAPGGGTDLAARAYGRAMEKPLKQ